MAPKLNFKRCSSPAHLFFSKRTEKCLMFMMDDKVKNETEA